MNAKNFPSPTPPLNAQQGSPDSDLDPIGKNTETILAFNLREEGTVTHFQRILESISSSLGRPLFLSSIMAFVVTWMLVNILMGKMGFTAIDLPPFPWLQGMVGLGALLTTIVVLIKQNRLAKMEERRAHLELQVNLLTEQKVTKLINLMEELRRDLPMIKNRHDAEVIAYQLPTNPESVLAALDERLETEAHRGQPEGID
ncbi:MAG: DUF1003 domain-containing protein [Burkholderiales bacterium]